MTDDQPQYLQVAFPEDDTITCYLHDQGNPLATLGPIADINFFIGANNSGKSRMLRWLCKREKHQLLSERIGKTLSADLVLVDSLNAELSKRPATFSWHSPEGRSPGRFRDKEGQRSFAELAGGPARNCVRDVFISPARSDKLQLLAVYARMFECGIAGKDPRATEPFVTRGVDPNDYSQAQIQGAIEIAAILDRWAVMTIGDGADPNATQRPDLTPRVPKDRVYIPILRSPNSLLLSDERVKHQEPFDRGDSDREKNFDRPAWKTRTEYQLGPVDVWSGQRLFRQILEDRNDRRATRIRFDAFVEFVRDAFFPGREIDIVANVRRRNDADDRTWGEILVNLGSTDDRVLYDLGDGVQALLLLLYPIFMAESHTWFFIEEPETHLHPGFQRLFLETLLKNPAIAEKDLKFFFTTHSNHFIDYSIEHNDRMRVFAFAEAPKVGNEQRFTVRSVLDDKRDVLRDLGVRNGSVQLANCAIWVEGPTDRLYIRAFLKAHAEADKQRVFREDLHYAFFEYGGSLLAHYDFNESEGEEEAENSDSDKLSEEQKAQIKAQFIANHVFLLADRDKDKEKKHNAFDAMQQGKDFVYSVTPGREVENLLSAEQLNLGHAGLYVPKGSEDEYRAVPIGDYLKTKLKKKGRTVKIAGPSGTLSEYWKRTFAERIPPKTTWDNMSDDARTLSKQIYDFVAHHNQTV